MGGLKFWCIKYSNEDLSCDDICMQTELLVRYQSRNFSDQSLAMTSNTLYLILADKTKILVHSDVIDKLWSEKFLDWKRTKSAVCMHMSSHDKSSFECFSHENLRPLAQSLAGNFSPVIVIKIIFFISGLFPV